MLPFRQRTELKEWQSVKAFSNKLRVSWQLMAISEASFYGDESGSHGEGSFILSGYLGSDKDWSAFEGQWHDVLHDSSIGGREIEYFHMRECYKLEDEFEHFNRFQADKKLRALVGVICHFVRRGRLKEFTSIIGWEEYERCVTGPLRDTFYNPYQFAFGAVFAEIANSVGKDGESIYFFLDDQIPKIEKDVAYQFITAKEMLPNTLGRIVQGPTFRSDKFCYPLQAADLIAWQRHHKELNLPEDRGEFTPELRRLNNASDKTGKIFRYREAGLKEFSAHIETHLRTKGLIE